jgi:hypothetical protein
VTVSPDGTPTHGLLAQTSNGSSAISAEGSHILFTSGGALYDRIDGEYTVQVDKKQAGAAGPSGGGVLQTASSDGSKVFFTDDKVLTQGSTAEPGKPDLYECEIVEEVGSTKHKGRAVAAPGQEREARESLSLATRAGRSDRRAYWRCPGENDLSLLSTLLVVLGTLLGCSLCD